MESLKKAQNETCPKSKSKWVVFITGGPGSGKGTLCQYISNKYPFIHHICAGDILRNWKDRYSDKEDLGKLQPDPKIYDHFPSTVYNIATLNAFIKQAMEDARILPEKFVGHILSNEIEAIEQRLGFQEHVFLIDGYPRNEDQTQDLLTRSFLKNLANIATIHFDCSKDVMLKRVTNRGGQRVDDNEITLRNRIQQHFYSFENIMKKFVVVLPASRMLSLDTSGSLEELKSSFEEILRQLELGYLMPD